MSLHTRVTDCDDTGDGTVNLGTPALYAGMSSDGTATITDAAGKTLASAVSGPTYLKFGDFEPAQSPIKIEAGALDRVTTIWSI